MASGSNVTPSKSYISINVTPTTKKLLCIVCGKREENDTYRVKLFKNGKKSDACVLIEKYLEIQLPQDQTVNSVCQNCYRSLSNIQSRLHNLKQKHEKTIAQLKVTHGRVSKKRLPFSEMMNESKKTYVDLPAEDMEMPMAIDKQSTSNVKCSEEEELSRVTDRIQQEIKKFCSKDNKNMLRSRNEDLGAITWTKISEDLKTVTPTFWHILQKSAHNPRQTTINLRKKEETNIPGIVSAGCKLISLQTRDLDAVQRLNSLILLKGGAKKSAFRRLHATNDCLSHQATLTMADNFGLKWESDLLQWVKDVDQDIAQEQLYALEIERLEEDAFFIDDPLESVSNMFHTEQIKTDLKNHRSTMHSGFYFVGDNIDMRTKVRQMTLKNQNKDQHMFQICSYKNRISGNELDNTKPKDEIETVEFKNFVPTTDEKERLIIEFAYLVALQWTELIPHFKPYRAVLPNHIEHEYTKQTRTKTERINMGVLKKNEQFNEDMTDICAFLNEYVPGAREENDQRKPEKILSGGDYLTFERHKQAQSAKRNGRTPMKRMEGLIPKMEEFHNQAEFLQVIWKILYSTASSKDTGTLYAARNSVNAKNVSKDPGSNYYASSELVDKFTKAYIVCAGLAHFNMENIEDAPNQNEYKGEIGSKVEMKEYILQHAKEVVKDCVALDTPEIPQTGYQSNNIVCEICGKKYKQAATLEKHEFEAHGLTPTVTETLSMEESPTEQDHILNYSKVSLFLGLLELNHDDAIKMGD